MSQSGNKISRIPKNLPDPARVSRFGTFLAVRDACQDEASQCRGPSALRDTIGGMDKKRDQPSWLKILIPLAVAVICLVAAWDEIGDSGKGLEFKAGIMIGVGISGAWLLGMIVKRLKSRCD